MNVDWLMTVWICWWILCNFTSNINNTIVQYVRYNIFNSYIMFEFSSNNSVNSREPLYLHISFHSIHCATSSLRFIGYFWKKELLTSPKSTKTKLPRFFTCGFRSKSLHSRIFTLTENTPPNTRQKPNSPPRWAEFPLNSRLQSAEHVGSPIDPPRRRCKPSPRSSFPRFHFLCPANGLFNIRQPRFPIR